jgi:hypothetical protein
MGRPPPSRGPASCSPRGPARADLPTTTEQPQRQAWQHDGSARERVIHARPRTQPHRPWRSCRSVLADAASRPPSKHRALSLSRARSVARPALASLLRWTSSDSVAFTPASTTALAGEGRAAGIACASVVGAELHTHPDVRVCSIGHDELIAVLLLRQQRGHAVQPAPGLWNVRDASARRRRTQASAASGRCGSWLRQRPPFVRPR